MITIPKRFSILGYTVTGEPTTKLRLANGAVGMADYDHLRILLQENTIEYPRIRANVEQTYLHEVLHWIFHCAHRYDLGEDEDLIDVLAGLLHQVLVTGKGEAKIDSL